MAIDPHPGRSSGLWLGTNVLSYHAVFGFVVCTAQVICIWCCVCCEEFSRDSHPVSKSRFGRPSWNPKYFENLGCHYIWDGNTLPPIFDHQRNREFREYKTTKD